MRQTRSPRFPIASTLLLAASVVATGPTTQQARAQQVLSMSVAAPAGAFGMGSRPAMTSKELDNYADILAFDDAQKDAAKSLVQTYTADFEAASKEHADKMRKISEEFQETKDDEVWQQMGPINEKFSKRSKELEATLLNDIKSLCSEKQLNSWPKFERTRRRERTIDRGTVSGESVDLVHIVKDLKLSPQAAKPLAEQLDAYELELDRALLDRNKVMDEQANAFTPGKRMEFDFEKFQDQMKRLRDAGAKIRDINQRYARAIESILAEDRRPEFQQTVKRASFPSVYKQSRPQRAFEAVMKFDDLDTKQRESIAALRQSYEAEAAGLNDKWATAIMDEEKNGSDGVIGFGGGAVMSIRMGDDNEDKSPTAVARKARKDLDRKTYQSLETLLTDAQKEKLPRGGDGREAEAVGGMPIIIGR